MRWTPTSLLPTLALLAALAPGCAYDVVAEESVLQVYDLEDDIAIGESVLERYLNACDQRAIAYDQDERLLGEIRAILARVSAVSHYPDLPWEAHLAEEEAVNAWCAPGGRIVVYRGLFDPERGLVRTRHELAAVIAHECAHATARHVSRARSRQYTLLMTSLPVYGALAVFAPAALDAFGLAFGQGMGLYLPAYSREQEEEADALGLVYMAKAGYDPHAALRVWRRAAGRERGGGGLYDTHPDHAARARALEALLPEALEAYEAAKRAARAGG